MGLEAVLPGPQNALYVLCFMLLNGRCTSLLRAPVSEMTYTVLSGMLNSTMPCHAMPSSVESCGALFSAR